MVQDITITSLETITAFDIVTGNLKFIMDELQSATIANSEEKTDITGKGGRKLSSLKKNKAVSISGTNGMLSGGLLADQVGGEFENKATDVMWADYQTVADASVTIKYTATGSTGNEISAIYIKNPDGTLGKELSQGSAVAAGVFTYTPASKKISFHASDVADGSEVIVYYKRHIQADVLENHGDVYSGKAELYIDAIGEDKCANVYRVQIHFPKADFVGNFDITLGDNQAVHSFEAESLAGGCGGSAYLWSYTVFGADAADVA